MKISQQMALLLRFFQNFCQTQVSALNIRNYMIFYSKNTCNKRRSWYDLFGHTSLLDSGMLFLISLAKIMWMYVFRKKNDFLFRWIYTFWDVLNLVKNFSKRSACLYACVTAYVRQTFLVNVTRKLTPPILGNFMYSCTLT